MNTISESEDRLSEHLAVPMEAQVRLAAQKRRLAIARYKLNIRRGSAWFKQVGRTRVRPAADDTDEQGVAPQG